MKLTPLALAAALFVATTPSLAQTQAAPPAADPAVELTGLAAWQLVVGNSVRGTVDGRSFVEHYGKDGSARIKVENRLMIGRWQVEGEEICFVYPGDPKECYQLKLRGTAVNWVDSKGLIDTSGELVEGNPDNL